MKRKEATKVLEVQEIKDILKEQSFDWKIFVHSPNPFLKAHDILFTNMTEITAEDQKLLHKITKKKKRKKK